MEGAKLSSGASLAFDWLQTGVVYTLTSLDLPPPKQPTPAPSKSPPPLSAFPSEALNQIGDCTALQNVDAIEVIGLETSFT